MAKRKPAKKTTAEDLDWSTEPQPVYVNTTTTVFSQDDFILAMGERRRVRSTTGEAEINRFLVSARMTPSHYAQTIATMIEAWNGYLKTNKMVGQVPVFSVEVKELRDEEG